MLKIFTYVKGTTRIMALIFCFYVSLVNSNFDICNSKNSVLHLCLYFGLSPNFDLIFSSLYVTFTD